MATFLIADDSMVMRTILKYMLESCGHQVVGEAKDREEAVRLCQSLSPEAVTVDVFMRGMDGILAMRQIKEHNPATRVFMVVDENQRNEEAKAPQAGVDGILRKPFELDSVRQELEKGFKAEVKKAED